MYKKKYWASGLTSHQSPITLKEPSRTIKRILE
jgi:hypothetical protein